MELKSWKMATRASGLPDRNRLPSLFEVLSRTTLPPVDLFSFYIFMRDQQRSVDYLDFWYVMGRITVFICQRNLLTYNPRLDVAQHMSLCRHYVGGLRQSMLIGTPDGDKSQSKRSSALLENIGDMNHPPAGPSMLASEKEKNSDAQLSALLREQPANGNNMGHSPAGSVGSNNSGIRQTQSNERQPRPSFMSSPQDLTTDSNSPDRRVARADIRASAEAILYTFLLSGSERQIILPEPLVIEISEAIENRGRDDPEVFDAAKDYVFQAMERDAFPGFLRAKALGNLVPPSIMLRLILGLLALFGAFWAAFTLIFLDYSRHIRAWVCSEDPGIAPVTNISSRLSSHLQSPSIVLFLTNTSSILSWHLLALVNTHS